jgi:predicted MFS family arabinose efflux permease
MALIFWVVPDAPPAPRATGGTFAGIFRDKNLLRLNFGVFVLHLIQTMMWVTIPAALVTRGGLTLGEHWKIYLPAVLLSFALMVPAVIVAERHGRFKQVFNAAVALVMLVQLGFYAWAETAWLIGGWLTLFFAAFNILEATQPSWISRVVAPGVKGSALGVYNTLQSLGLFLGGAAGGWLARHFDIGGVSAACGALAFVWLLLSLSMTPPPTRAHAVRAGQPGALLA